MKRKKARKKRKRSDHPFDIGAWVAASRRAQGLPPTITDPSALDRIAEIMRMPPPSKDA